jgi:hypothetical protein
MKTALFLAVVATLVGAARADVELGTYRGTSQTTVKFRNPATLQVTATRRYSRKLKVLVTEPKAFGGVTEANPFSFVIEPINQGAVPIAGSIFAASARFIQDDDTFRLLQYWTVRETQSGFTGALADAHVADGLARDVLITPLSSPSGTLRAHKFHDTRLAAPLRVNIEGIVEGNELTVTLSGYAYVKNRAVISFQTVINALKR